MGLLVFGVKESFFAIDCWNDSQYSKLLSLNGCGLDNGAVLKVLPRSQDFSVQSAIELVSELIERKERVEEAKRYERQPRDTQRQEKMRGRLSLKVLVILPQNNKRVCLLQKGWPLKVL